MAESSDLKAFTKLHTKAIEVDQANVGAWTKRVSIQKVLRQESPTIGQQGWQNWEQLPLSYTPSCDLAQAETTARESAYAWVQAKICHNVIAKIKNAISSKEQEGFTMVSATPIATKSEQASIQSWADKAMQTSGANSIYQDISSLVNELSKSMGADFGFMLKYRMTLIIPGELLPYMMAQTASNLPAAKELLEKTYPKLQILPYVGMTTDAGPFAVLVCDDVVFGQKEIGFLEMQGSIQLHFREPEEDQANPIYKLSAPYHRLVITHPEQIAVLTGI